MAESARQHVLVGGNLEELRDKLQWHVPQCTFELAPTLDQLADSVAAGHFDLLFLDDSLGQPGLPAIVGELKKIPSLAQAKVLCSLNKATHNDVQQLVKLGVAGVLHHPLASKEVARQLARLTGGHVPAVRLFETGSTEPPAAGTEQRKTWARGLKRAQESFEAITRQRLTTLAEALSRGELETRRRELERGANSMAGSFSVFGYPDATPIARQLKDLLGAPLNSQDKRAVAELAGRLYSLLGQTPGRSLLPQRGDAPTVLLIAESEELHADLAAHGAASELRILACSRDFESQEAEPEMVVADLDMEGDWRARLARFECPVLGLLTDPTPELRVAAARHGVATILEKPVAVGSLVEKIHEQVVDRSAPPAVVVILGGNPVLNAQLEGLLSPLQVQLCVADNLDTLWQHLEWRAPDLLMVDLEVGHRVDLCAAVRGDPRWADLPVIFVSRDQAPETRRRVFDAGGDDLIRRPIDGPELQARVRSRLKRSRHARRLAETDPLTGAATRRKAVPWLRRYLSLGQRRLIPVSIAVIDLDHFKHVNDTHGHPAGDRVLKGVSELLMKTFRSEDVVARWGGEEFVVGMFTMTRGQAVKRLEAFLERVYKEVFQSETGEDFSVSFSAGVAQFPEDGFDLESLYEAADQALYEAKARGRRCVVGAQTQSQFERVDLAVIESDEVLGSVLEEELTGNSLTCRLFVNPEKALLSLAGSPPGLRARVVLLDADLPGSAWSKIMTRLARDRVLESCRVLMMGNLPEEEVLRAYDLGVDDYIPKQPFSLGILMRRLRRALD